MILPEMVQSAREIEWARLGQPMLLQVIDPDDLALANCSDAEWFHSLVTWPWQEYREVAALYYEALARANEEAAAARAQRRLDDDAASQSNPESRDEARQRLLFDRPTGGNKNAPILQPAATPPESSAGAGAPEKWKVDPQALAPGRTPVRVAGMKPKCFFAMAKAFIGTALMGHAPDPGDVHRQLIDNPTFARACGFAPRLDGVYHCEQVPGLRKLEQFDQIMTDNGLWSQLKYDAIRRNFDSGAVKPEIQIVHDTTHYHAASAFEVVKYPNSAGTEQKKSQSKPTKRCQCEDKDTCSHKWELADDGAGTVVKSSNRMHWAHKSSVLSLPAQGVMVDALAVADASTHDSQTLVPNLARTFKAIPELLPSLRYVLDDSAADDAGLRTEVNKQFDLVLRASLNVRRRSDLTVGLPRGMETLTPRGELICGGGFHLDYQGIRWGANSFIYGPPRGPGGTSRCLSCPLREQCCPHAGIGRVATVKFDLLPHIDPNDPPMAKRFQAMMTLRPAVERTIKRVKCDLGDAQLGKRGNVAFQGRLDKSLLALHLLLRR